MFDSFGSALFKIGVGAAAAGGLMMLVHEMTDSADDDTALDEDDEYEEDKEGEEDEKGEADEERQTGAPAESDA